jgi:hypothetical protein
VLEKFTYLELFYNPNMQSTLLNMDYRLAFDVVGYAKTRHFLQTLTWWNIDCYFVTLKDLDKNLFFLSVPIRDALDLERTVRGYCPYRLTW